MFEEKQKKWQETRDAKELKKKQQKAHHSLSEKRRRRSELMEMSEGGPFQRTYQVEKPGWYRVCVSTREHKVIAEIEMRKQSELGFPNRRTGHLMTYERFEMLKEERKIARKARANYAKMVVNSIFETAFYIAISAFQVYTIRKWFAGGPMLGF